MLHIDDSDLRRAMVHLAKAFKGVDKKIKRHGSAKLRKVMKPLVQKRKTAALRLPSRGHPGEGMRQAVARQVRGATRWTGKRGGVFIIQRGRGMPRNFNMAGRAFNREEGWNPQNLGGEVTHQEMQPTQWFDSQHDPAEARMVRQQVIQALDEVAASLADEIRRTR